MSGKYGSHPTPLRRAQVRITSGFNHIAELAAALALALALLGFFSFNSSEEDRCQAALEGLPMAAPADQVTGSLADALLLAAFVFCRSFLPAVPPLRMRNAGLCLWLGSARNLDKHSHK